MKVILISLTIVSVLVGSAVSNPLLENVVLGRTLVQRDMRCGTRSAYKTIHMANYDPITQDCRYNIRAYSTKVCQLRVNIRHLSLATPASYTPYARCTGEMLRIEGLRVNGVDFNLCGRMGSQHVYVPWTVNRITDEKLIEIQVRSGSTAQWALEVNQIECNHVATIVTPDDRQAPEGCLQYFHEASGTVQSFTDGLVYFGDTRYAICFDTNNMNDAVLELTNIRFSMSALATATNGFDIECLDSAGASSTESDYLVIPTARVTGGAAPGFYSLFCLTSLQGVTLRTNGFGPIVIYVNTDRDTDPTGETGFTFNYSVTRT